MRIDECIFPSCDRRPHGKGLCRAHYNQARRGGPLKPLELPVSEWKALAEVEDFEFLIESGSSVDLALRRVGVCGRTMQRRYRALGRPAPSMLATFADSRRK